MGTKSCWKNWVATIYVPAVRAVNSKSVVFGAGQYDGSRRDHFFQGLANRGREDFPPCPDEAIGIGRHGRSSPKCYSSPIASQGIMHAMNRRMFFIEGAAASALLTGTRYLSADPLGLPIGCQTYPVRKSISTDFAGTMKGLRAAGFTQIELCSPYGYSDFSSLQQYKPQELRRMLNDWGLGCISSHWAATELFQKTDESIAYAKEFGMTQMAIAALGPFHAKSTQTVDDVKRYVEPFNAFAEKAHAAGIVALLHNEGFVSEYIDGKPVYDMMDRRTQSCHNQAAVSGL